MILLTLFLSDNIAGYFPFGVAVIAAALLALFIPIFLLTRPESSRRDKLVALGLGSLPIWFGDMSSDYWYIFSLSLVFALLRIMFNVSSRY